MGKLCALEGSFDQRWWGVQVGGWKAQVCTLRTPPLPPHSLTPNTMIFALPPPPRLSTSFADYWSRRWNLTVSYMLRWVTHY